MGFLKAFVFLFLATACGEEKKITENPVVVATYSILADIVANITEGTAIQVKTLVPRLSDPHTFEPKPEDFAVLSNAHIIFAHGLRFEGWLDHALGRNSTKVVYIAAYHPARKLDDGSVDPHTWHDIKMMQSSITIIAETLSAHFPKYAERFKENAKVYSQKLEALDLEISELLKNLPPSVTRIVLTTHDAFHYFGVRYNIEFIAPVGVTTEAEPKAQAISKLIERIKHDNIRAVFIENLSNQKSVQQIVKETGVHIEGTLYADSLSPENGQAPTYIEMMRYNARAIRKSLTGVPQ